MKIIKKYLGLVWILLSISSVIILIRMAIINISTDGGAEIHNPIPWIIIITIYLPIAFAFALFGYYAFKNEYHT
jgi:amino acid transporter